MSRWLGYDIAPSSHALHQPIAQHAEARIRQAPIHTKQRPHLARVARTAKLVRGANEMAMRFHNPALANATGAKAYVDAQWSEATVKQRYDWIFEYDATRVGV